ncbi:MAG: AMP-binding protein [Acidimicrobiales bacterium]
MIFPALCDIAAQAPDRTAVIDQRGRHLTFGELCESVERVATSLRGLGLGPQSSVALFAPNRVEWLVTSLATAAIGSLSIGLNTRFRTAELDYLLHVGRCDAVLVPDRFLGVRPAELLLGIRDTPRVLVDGDPSAFDARFSPIAWTDLDQAAAPASTSPERPTVTGDERWCGFTTSGTTGHPKLAVHTQAGTLHHLRAVIDAFDLDHDTVAYVPLPLCGVFGFTVAYATLLAGGTTVLHETFDPAAGAAAIAEHRVTFANGSDDMLTAIFEQPAFDGATTTWTNGVYADFTNSGRQVAELADRLTDGRLRLSGVYGSSEGFALMSRWPAAAPLEERAVNGGRLVSDQLEVRCVDPATGAVLPHGEPGEIQFRGPGMIDGYLEHPDAPETTAATVAAFTDDRWFRTGDLGHTVDGRAFVYRSRLGDSLRLRGFLCDPTEIEHHLERHEAVELAQVVGVDRPGGEVAVAFVRLAPGGTATPDDLIAHCANGLANYKTPDRVVIVDEFPVTDGPNGVKIRKVDLRSAAIAWYTEHDQLDPTLSSST